MITLIAAVARNMVIGNQNSIPWHLPADFRLFKETTRHHPIVMGSRTWESLPKRPLPDRSNIVISRLPPEHHGGAIWCSDIGSAIIEAYQHDNDIFVIGGSSIYAQTIDIADRLIISWVDLEPVGDTFFPDISSDWMVVEERPYEGFTLRIYERKG